MTVAGRDWLARRPRSQLVVGAAAALTLLTWPIGSIAPTIGVDPSWQIALHLAATHRLDYGTEIVYTYGPLGFLVVPVLVSMTTLLLALAFVAVAHIALYATVLASALRTFPVAVAVALTWLAGTLVLQESDVVLVIAFFLCLVSLESLSPPAWVPPAGGALAAVGLLIKIDVGVVAVLLVAIAAWFAPRRLRAELAAAGTFVVVFLVLWLASGNALSALPWWIVRGVEIASAYGDSLAREDSSVQWQYPAAGLVALAAAALLWLQGRGTSRARRIAIGASFLVYAFFYVKQGFVRHDVHGVFFFGGLALGLLAVPWRSRLRVGAAGLVVAAAACVVASPGMTVAQIVRPDRRLHALASEAKLVLLPGARRDAQRSWRLAARRTLGVDVRALELVGGRPVHVDPSETAVVWAYGLEWKPLPVFQAYAAYTPRLDDVNSDALASRDGPERILRQAGVHVDHVAPEFDSPDAFVAMLCRYRELYATARWQVLARATDRCEAPRPLGVATAAPGQDIEVPRAPSPTALVVARFDVPTTLGDRLERLAFKKRAIPKIVLNGTRTNRFVVATAPDLHVLRVGRVGFSPAFGGALQTSRLRLLAVRGPIRVRFYAIPIRPGGD